MVAGWQPRSPCGGAPRTHETMAYGLPPLFADLLHQSIGRAIWTIGVRLGVGPVIRVEVSDVLDVLGASRAVVKRVVIRP